MTHDLTGATIEVILADRTRARISLTELLNHLASLTAPVDDTFGHSHDCIITSKQVAELSEKHRVSIREATDTLNRCEGHVVRADTAPSKTPAHPLSDEAEAADIVNPQANAMFVTNDFVETVAKANDGNNAAVAKVADALDATPVAKKVSAKTAGKKAGSAS